MAPQKRHEGRETKAPRPEARCRGLLVPCSAVVQLSEPTWLVTSCLPALPVPPSIENEDLEEAIKVPEGDTAHLTCNATGKATPGGWAKGDEAASERGSWGAGLPVPSPSALHPSTDRTGPWWPCDMDAPQPGSGVFEGPRSTLSPWFLQCHAWVDGWLDGWVDGWNNFFCLY